MTGALMRGDKCATGKKRLPQAQLDTIGIGAAG